MGLHQIKRLPHCKRIRIVNRLPLEMAEDIWKLSHKRLIPKVYQELTSKNK